LPEEVLRQLEKLAKQEGATTGDLIRRLLEAHVANQAPPPDNGYDVRLPLIPASETGPIQPIMRDGLPWT
jgi:ribbon-helix-helix CopG family protein